MAQRNSSTGYEMVYWVIDLLTTVSFLYARTLISFNGSNGSILINCSSINNSLIMCLPDLDCSAHFRNSLIRFYYNSGSKGDYK